MKSVKSRQINDILKNSTAIIDTINDLSEEEQHKVKIVFIENSRKKMSKYLSNLEIMILKQTYFTRLFWKYNEICISNTKSVFSCYRFSKKMIKIPNTMEIITDILLKTEIDISGIFRINSTAERIASIVNLLNQICDNSLSREKGEFQIRENYDVVDLSETYKSGYKFLNTSVIPMQMQQIAIKITDIKDDDDKKTCTLAFLYGLPLTNRNILESCVFVCKIIEKKLALINSKEKLSMAGLAAVMMPNLIRPDMDTLDYNALTQLSEFIRYVFENFEELAKL
ncbi:hypothetical protein GINT2_000819 [Glugoides intestinalis]